MMPFRTFITVIAALLACDQALASDDALLRLIESRRAADREIALQIWNWAEVGYQETQTSARLQKELVSAGFRVTAGVAGMPTAFVAEYGSGQPVIAILAEMDALPGVSQAATPERQPLRGRISGHACGHHLFGTGSASAAIAVKDWMQREGVRGTIRLTGRQPRRAVRVRRTWCAPGSLTMWMLRCTGMRAIAMP